MSTITNYLQVRSPNLNLGKTPKMNKEPIVNNVLFPTIKNSKSSKGISDVINKDPFVSIYCCGVGC